jgi:phosphatidylserine decarboxylase
VALTILITIVGVLLYWRFIYFFRDPERIIPSGNNVVSPADGTIVYIKKIDKGCIPLSIKNKKEIKLEEITKVDFKSKFEGGYIIGIFMSPWDVHVNRAPIKGRIEDIFYYQSKFNLTMAKVTLNKLLKRKELLPLAPHYLFENERNSLIIHGDFPVAVIQIADQYVNKIECWVKKDQLVEKGERIGLIRMGSQVDILLSSLNDKVRILVKEGIHVKAGETILAVY